LDFALERLSESLQQDVSRYLDRLAGRDLLDERAPRPVRPATLLCREYQLRMFASALVRRGRNPASLTSLADLVAIETFKDGLRHLLEHRGGKSTTGIVNVAACLKAVARHHVKLDAASRQSAVISELLLMAPIRRQCPVGIQQRLAYGLLRNR
jgi:hypothetical protein